ncbi:class I SAM-dependent methyltransferase, partial [Candidatus Gottesmanbacteria bacterium]|nr:class I SAM-dependent methyltransferase [Candidatus Gottesmanbacteria bacterium]
MLPKNCYLCDHQGMETAFFKLGHRILVCPSCGLYSLDFPGNYQKFLTTYYSKGFFTGGKHYRAYADYVGDKETILKNMKKYLTVIRKYKKSGRLLDLGCAMGFLIELAEKQGFSGVGVDVSRYAVDLAKKLVGKEKVFLGRVEELSSLLSSRAIPTYVGRVEGSSAERVSLDSSTHPLSGFGRNDKNEMFDIVTMFDLIEHLEKPKNVLKQVAQVLKKDGLLVIQTGDVASFWAKLMGKNWHFFAPPQHFYFYSQKNLSDLLSQTGFKVIKIQKIGKWVSLRYLFHMMRYINKDSIGDVLYNLTAKNFLGQIPVFMRMNDNMIV